MEHALATSLVVDRVYLAALFTCWLLWHAQVAYTTDVGLLESVQLHPGLDQQLRWSIKLPILRGFPDHVLLTDLFCVRVTLNGQFLLIQMGLNQAERSTVFSKDGCRPLKILQLSAVFLGLLLSWLFDNLWHADRILVLKNNLFVVHCGVLLGLILRLNEELAEVGARLVQQPPHRVMPGLFLYNLLSSLVSVLLRTLLLYHHLLRLITLSTHQQDRVFRGGLSLEWEFGLGRDAHRALHFNRLCPYARNYTQCVVE